MTQCRTTAVARHERHRDREIATGAVPGHRDPTGVDAECGSGIHHVLECSVAIFYRPWKTRLRRQAVIDGHHHRPGRQGEGAGQMVVAVQIAQDPTTPMEEQRDGKPCLRGGVIDT